MESEYYNAYFIDKDGNKISSEKALDHTLLVMEMFDEDESLKKEFEESREFDPIDFLVKKGYIKISESKKHPECNYIVYSSKMLSPKQKEIVKQYIARRFNRSDLDELENNNDWERFFDF